MRASIKITCALKSISPQILNRLSKAAKAAFKPALRTALWIVKLTVPITLTISVLSYLGVVAWISVQLLPLFALMGLSGEAALVFISASLGNLYSGIAVMATIGVDYRSAIILATMGLICHNMIIETAIQRKAGASVKLIVPLRIAMSLLSGVLLNLILPEGLTGRLYMGSASVAATTWGEVFVNWALTLAPLLLKMVVLIVSLNILQSILREFRIINLIAVPLRPAMKVFGLPYSTSFLWIICNVIGLTYGGAAIIDEVQRGEATPADARLLNTHVAISHSLLEDTLLFASMGLPVFWLIAPRMVLAIGAVWLHRAIRFFRQSDNI